MQKLDELMSKACLASELGKKCITVDLQMLSQIRDGFWELEKRAEAAEAKLAELAKQEPAAFTSEHYWSELNTFGAVKCVLLKNGNDPDFQVELFTRPAPAINLAELVPEAKPEHTTGDHIDSITHWCAGWNSCRANILRNIEETK